MLYSLCRTYAEHANPNIEPHPNQNACTLAWRRRIGCCRHHCHCHHHHRTLVGRESERAKTVADRVAAVSPHAIRRSAVVGDGCTQFTQHSHPSALRSPFRRTNTHSHTHKPTASTRPLAATPPPTHRLRHSDIFATYASVFDTVISRYDRQTHTQLVRQRCGG